jgi:CheY-like chemotaxis protein
MKSILIVEDDANYREILKRKFESEGYEVLEASDGQEAIGIISRRDISLILLDLLMPGMDGVTFYFHMQNTVKKNIPTIILTNLSETSMQTDIKEFLVKANVSIDDVVEKVKKHIS